jgi:hypothetical protein
LSERLEECLSQELPLGNAGLAVVIHHRFQNSTDNNYFALCSKIQTISTYKFSKTIISKTKT